MADGTTSMCTAGSPATNADPTRAPYADPTLIPRDPTVIRRDPCASRPGHRWPPDGSSKADSIHVDAQVIKTEICVATIRLWPRRDVRGAAIACFKNRPVRTPWLL
jgi:hypothetical protein